MKDFAAFIKANKKKAYRLAWNNSPHNEHGSVLIEPDGEIANDIFWDEYFERIDRIEENKTSRSMESVFSVQG
ncbi:MAG: hypothetical protein ACI3U2_00655 [Anaerovibrio sp.]